MGLPSSGAAYDGDGDSLYDDADREETSLEAPRPTGTGRGSALP